MFKWSVICSSSVQQYRRQTALISQRNARPKKSCNSCFFSQWSHPMAYWLGLLFADGCILQRHNRLSVFLGLKCSDAQHIELFQKAIQSTYKIGVRKNGLASSCMTIVDINSARMVQDLMNHGCTPRKSLTLKWNEQVPASLMHHFVRGYFDGDGCISFVKRSGCWVVSFVGNKEFITKLRCNIKRGALNDSTSNGYINKISEQVIVLEYRGVHCPMAVLDWMYKGSDESTRLSRKFVFYQFLRNIVHLKPYNRKQRFEEFANSSEWIQQLDCKMKERCPHRRLPLKSIGVDSTYKVQQIDMETHRIVKVWEKAIEVQHELGFGVGNILKVCRGEGKSAYGFTISPRLRARFI